MDGCVKAVEIQAFQFAARTWTRNAAKEWLDDHNFISAVYRTRENDDGELITHIYPQFDPQDPRIDTSSWATISDTFPDGVSATTCVRQEKNVMQNMKQKAGRQSSADPFDFVMSDESVDRVGDVVRAKGWDLDQFQRNPIALFGHSHDKIIGTWENVRVVGKKLMGRLKLAEKGTSPEIDTIWKLIEQRILKAVSVGFQPLEGNPIKDTGGFEFTKQILHECSLVAVPANANALSIAKSLGADPDKIFASTTEGHTDAPVHGHGTGTTKGTASGRMSRTQPETSNQRKKPMDISKRIAAKKERLVSIKDDLTTLKGLLEDDDYELTDEEQDRIEILADEEASVIKSIESLEKLEQGLARKAAPVQAMPARGVAPGAPAKKVKGGSLFAKHVTAQLYAKEFGVPLREMVEQIYGNDDEVKATLPFTVEKTGTPAADTATNGWAAELIESDTEAFLEELQPISVYAALRARGRGMNFAGMGSLKIPQRAPAAPGTNDMAGDWVGELGVIPVKRGAVTAQTIEPYKLAVISAWSQELDMRSVPAIEGLVRQMMLEDTAKTLDGYLLDTAAGVARVRPAGLLHNVSATNSQGVNAADIITDLKVLFSAMQAARVGANPVIIMNSIRLLGLSTVTTAAGGFMFRDEVAAGRLLGVPVIAAEHVPAASVVIVDAGSFVGANDTPRFSVSDQAILSMANADTTPPTQAQDGSGGVGATAGQVAPDDGIKVGSDLTAAANAGAEYLNLYQQYALAVRMILPTTWAMTRPGGVAALAQVAW